MLKYRTLSLHYTHHPDYVLDIHRNFIRILNEQKSLNLREPEIKKLGFLRRRRFYVSEFWGIRVRTTTRDEHNNDLFVDIDEKKFPWLSKVRDLKELIEGHQEIFGNPVK